ncbi:terminase small subunit [uncultured Mucilaginibacter sp.]|uniref:terminase small subunit n=1 Tax=uncultured Mucilaginibacter sp. TaxID=797541 RepID=UPI0025D38E5E|nr:terminase small subunit [uncultured Mucilaginibacter sp.]
MLKIFAFFKNYPYIYTYNMPIGNPIIMRSNKYILFQKAHHLRAKVAEYFNYIKGIYHIELLPFKATAKSTPEMREQRVWDREPQPPTLSGLALFLGFESLQAFLLYEQNGAYASTLKRARLQIEAEYEKQLTSQPATGAIFALKSLGWMEKQAEKDGSNSALNTLRIEIVATGPTPAQHEREVTL